MYVCVALNASPSWFMLTYIYLGNYIAIILLVVVASQRLGHCAETMWTC